MSAAAIADEVGRLVGQDRVIKTFHGGRIEIGPCHFVDYQKPDGVFVSIERSTHESLNGKGLVHLTPKKIRQLRRVLKSLLREIEGV